MPTYDANDVFDLLSAMNRETLGRIEREIQGIRTLLEAVNITTLGRMEEKINFLEQQYLTEQQIREGVKRPLDPSKLFK